eukprot:7657984-Pyramimonas_sp.AAC.1
MALTAELGDTYHDDEHGDTTDDEDGYADYTQRRRLGLQTPNGTGNGDIYSGANNCRNAWYRNVSQIGESVWGLEYERPGVPTVRKHVSTHLENTFSSTASPPGARIAELTVQGRKFTVQGHEFTVRGHAFTV